MKFIEEFEDSVQVEVGGQDFIAEVDFGLFQDWVGETTRVVLIGEEYEDIPCSFEYWKEHYWAEYESKLIEYIEHFCEIKPLVP